MEALLILLGVVGFGAILIAVHVFSVDGVPFGGHGSEGGNPEMSAGLVERSGGDRRSAREVVFPLLDNEMAIQQERRQQLDRRQTVS